MNKNILGDFRICISVPLIEDDFKKLNPESKELHILGNININTFLIDDNRSIFEIRKNTP